MFSYSFLGGKLKLSEFYRIELEYDSWEIPIVVWFI